MSQNTEPVNLQILACCLFLIFIQEIRLNMPSAKWRPFSIGLIGLGIRRHRISCCPITVCFIMTSSNGNIFRVTGPLWGEVTGEIPSQRPVTLCFLWSAPEQTVEQTTKTPVISDVTVMYRESHHYDKLIFLTTIVKPNMRINGGCRYMKIPIPILVMKACKYFYFFKRSVKVDMVL